MADEYVVVHFIWLGPCENYRGIAQGRAYPISRQVNSLHHVQLAQMLYFWFWHVE
jgi:hypothetical protein